MDFLKEFSRQFSGKGRSSAEKSKAGAEFNRLSAELADAEAALERLYTRYSRACYAIQAGRGSPDAARELALRIQAAALQVEELSAARDAVRELKWCLNCGAMFDREARFCSACGKKLPEEAPKPEPVAPGEYCPECGAKREDGDGRCPVCGRDFSQPSPPEPLDVPPIPDDLPAPEEPDGNIE